MDRRTFIRTFSAGLSAVPLIGNAQQPPAMYRIGFLSEGAAPNLKPFWDAMREFGWVENENVSLEARYAATTDQLPVFAAELVRRKVDLIVVWGTRATRAAKQATGTIPIVFVVGSDPVEEGLVASLARPGGNLTGFAYGIYADKQLEILRAALPGIRRVAYPRLGERHGAAIEHAGKALQLHLHGTSVRAPEDFDLLFVTARKTKADAVLIQDVAWFLPHLASIATSSIENRLPAIGPTRAFADAGGLLSYGPKPQSDLLVAAHVDKIRKGARPADLPIEQPTLFELVINRKAASVLGVKIAPQVMQRATDVVG